MAESFLKLSNLINFLSTSAVGAGDAAATLTKIFWGKIGWIWAKLVNLGNFG